MATDFNSFSTNNSTPNFELKDFVKTNSIIGQFAFLLFAIFIFIILLRLGIFALTYFLKTSNTKLINGMIDAKQSLTFNQDPSGNPYTAIPRSDNEEDGIEFTWSVWIYINNLNYLNNQYRTVFFKGNNNLTPNGLNMPNNAPGLYITPNKNSLVVMMSTFNDINKEVVIPNIPVNKWVNVIIRCEDKNLQVYINGIVTRSVKLMGVPKQNYGDVYVSTNGGFDGYTSNLWYYNKALGISEIQSIVNKGPSTKMATESSTGVSDTNASYLSSQWYIKM